MARMGQREMAGFGWVALGGAAGACARYLVGNVAARFGEFPFGTLIVNVTGSLALGLIAGLLTLQEVTSSEPLRLGLGVGFLGAYTTFSTFAVDTVMLAERGLGPLLINVLANNGLALLAAAVGFLAARVAG